MRLILSRKGFDSGSGGCPSPIFPDGSLVSLPIPDSNSIVAYDEITDSNGHNIGKIVESLTGNRILGASHAHLDPDLFIGSTSRENGFHAALGQVGAAQGHLSNQGVSVGDIFIFFGLFKPIIVEDNQFAFNKFSRCQHIIYGWLQIKNIIQVDILTCIKFPALLRHPHLYGTRQNNNTIYLAEDELTLPNIGKTGLPGAGIFKSIRKILILTDPVEDGLCIWNLPDWMHPKYGVCSVSYHGDVNRWRTKDGVSLLNSVNRGQEFVVDLLDKKHLADLENYILSLFSDELGIINPQPESVSCNS